MSGEQALTRIEPIPLAMPEPTTPAALMRRATDVAGICREIVLKTACEIQGRKFVKVEGWESIATAHGCFAGAEDADRVYDNQGNHIGYKAKGVLRNAHGEVIATGEGYVGFDEKDRKGNPTWKNRAEYAGKAMAQTRAISRTCRGVFAHVVVLIDAGLSTTPAEEVPDGGFDDNARAARAKPANVRRTNVPQTDELERLTDDIMQMRERGETGTADVSGMPPELHERAKVLAFQQYESRATCQGELSQLLECLTEAGQTRENALRSLRRCAGAKASSGLQQSSSGKMVMPKSPSSSAQSVQGIATEEQRLRWIAELKLRGDWALGYCYDKAWLMPESGPDDDRTPGEPLEMLEARHVPTTRKQADAILAELDSLIPADQRPKAAGASRPPSTSAPANQNASQWQGRGNKPGSGDTAHHSEDWYQFVLPFGKDKGSMLGELDKKTLFGWWANFEVEHEYQGKPKKPETIAKDERFRAMLDEAGAFYKFEEPND